MKKGLLFTTLIFSLAINISIGQTLVLPGEGVLSEAIANAADGDIIHLIAGAEYTEIGDEFGVIDKNITITIEGDDYSIKPILKFSISDDNTRSFFALQDGASITLRGLELDGSYDGIATAAHCMQADIGDPAQETFIKRVMIDNCYIHHLQDNLVDAGNSSMISYVIYDSTYIHNSIIHDIATSIYFKYAGANWISIRNSTFYRLTSYGLRVAGPGESQNYDNTPAALIDHTTWYDIGSLDPREIIQVEKGPHKGPWTVTNSIFQKQVGLTRTVINIKDVPDSTSVVSNISYWEVGPRKWTNNGIKIVRDTLQADAEFADPENGDFTLPSGSQLYTFGTDGKAIGDPRWAPDQDPVAVEEEAAIPTEFGLEQNFPNPFNPATTIKFNISKAGHITLKVYDVLGSEIATIVNNRLSAGRYSYNFDAQNLPSGIYLYKLSAGNSVLTRKMVLAK
jgi:hypothetical protein